jgi:hypothetical protein
MHVSVPIAPGELCDRLTIAALKVARSRPEDLDVLEAQLALYRAAYDALPVEAEVAASLCALKRFNGILWRLEDEIRAREAAADYGKRFVTVARLISRVNDRRARAKRAIDEALGVSSAEMKIYRFGVAAS